MCCRESCWQVVAVVVLSCTQGYFAAGQQTGAPEPLRTLKREYALTHTAKEQHVKARHAFLLNDASDRYTFYLNQQLSSRGLTLTDSQAMPTGSTPEVEQANRFGAAIYPCEVNGNWTAGWQGYETYLKLWPDGPDAEEAWWRGRLRHQLIACIDAAGTEDEAADLVHDYTDFLRRFPQGRHRAEAGKLLDEFKAQLVVYERGIGRPVPRT